MPVTSDNMLSSINFAVGSKSSSAILLPLPEPERTTWRLILHTLSVRHCAAFVREEEGKWMVVEARGTPSPSEQEGGIHLSLRYLTASEIQVLPFLENRMNGEGVRDFGVGSDQLTVPLLSANRMCGFLQASERTVSVPFSEHDRITLQLLGHHVLSSLRSILATSEDDHSPVYIDYLTDLYNYRYFCQRLTREILQAELSDQPLSLLMIDLNQYKRINDSYGHEIGNVVLAQIASLLRLAVREMDVACRYGGDEFVVILPHTDNEQALTVAHRLEGALRASQVDIPGVGPIATPSLSIGVSTFPSPSPSAEGLIRQADQAHYAAKRDPARAIRSFEEKSPPLTS